MSETVVHKSLADAKLAVMKEVPYVKKTKSQGLNYTFASEAELIAHLHPVMASHGITISPAKVVVAHRGQYQTSKGAAMNNVMLVVTYRLTHAASGTSEDCEAAGEAADVGDKATPKAMTCALKYALRQTFLIETGDDPDKYPSEPAAQPSVAPRANGKPVTGAELLRRMQQFDAKLASQGVCQPGQMVAEIVAAATRAGKPADVTQWANGMIEWAEKAAKTFAQRARAAAGGNGTPAANGQPPTNGGQAKTIDEEQLQALSKMLAQKGKAPRNVWVFLRLPTDSDLLDLTQQQFTDVMKALSQQPDAQPAEAGR